MSLATIIDERGIKRSWIAEKIGVSRSAITRWADGDWPIPPRRAEELAALLNVPLSDLQSKEPSQ